MSNARMIAAGRRQGGGKRLGSRSGFTLIELMVTLAVVGLLAAVAAPAMQSLVNGNRLSGTVSELTASLQLARSEALRRSSPVTICGSSDGATCGGDWSRWIVTGTEMSGAAVVVQDNAAASPAVQVSGPAGGIVFRSSGLANGQAQLTVCVPTDSPVENQRIVTVMISGAVVNQRQSGGGTCP